MKLIDADELMEHIGRDRLDSREAIMEMVKNAPTIEPERKKGKWIEWNPLNSDKCRLIQCNQCGNAYIVGYNIDYDDWIDGRNFCVKCGADMRPREEEQDEADD